MFARLGHLRDARIQFMHQVAVAGSQGGRQLPISADRMDNQATGNPGGVQNRPGKITFGDFLTRLSGPKNGHGCKQYQAHGDSRRDTTETVRTTWAVVSLPGLRQPARSAPLWHKSTAALTPKRETPARIRKRKPRLRSGPVLSNGTIDGRRLANHHL